MGLWFTCIDASGEDPGSGRHGSLDEPFAKNLLEFWLQFKVLQPPVDRDEKFGELQLPLLGHQMQQQVRLGVIRHSHVLTDRRTRVSDRADIRTDTVLLVFYAPKF